MRKKIEVDRDWKHQNLNYPLSRGEWQILSRETWIGKYGLKVHHDTVIRPDRKKGVYEHVEIKPGVSILPIDTDRTVYLADGFQYGLGDYSLEIAGGGIEDGENFEDAARRELKEELGITTGILVDLGPCNQMTGLLYSPQRSFMAKGISVGEANQGPTERILSVKMSLDEAVERIMSGEISDAPAMTTILKANEHIRRYGL